MKESIRMIAYARHRHRDAHILPAAMTVIEGLRVQENLDLTPATMRQVVIAMRFIKRITKSQQQFHTELKKSITLTQAERIYGPNIDRETKDWKTKPRKMVSGILAALGLA